MMRIENRDLTEKKEGLLCRNILWYVVFCGFAISAMLETNLSLTIIVMVIPRPMAAIVAECKHDELMTSNLSKLWVNASTSVENFEKHNLTQTHVPPLELTARPENTTPSAPVQYPDRFAWNEYDQGLALGGIFWAHWVTQLPGGILARHYGPKLVFGWSNLGLALLGFLLPFFARYHIYAFVALRVIQGFISGFAWPAMHSMTAKWIPLHERSKFISAYLGSSAGTALGFPLYSMLINWFGWDSVFYVTSTIGVIWYIAWYYLVYDTPQEHPRISEAERTYISQNVGDTVDYSVSKPVPWKAILISGPFWISTIAHCGCTWGWLTIVTESPSYFNYIHGWNISAIGVLSAAPHIGRILFSYAFSSLADWILRTKRMSTSNLRKFAVFITNGIQSIMLLGLAFNGCHSYLAIMFTILGMISSGAATAGTFPNTIDLSPNYASVLFGICCIVSMPSGFLGPLLVGILTNDNQTVEQWRLVFLISAAIVFLSGVPFMFFGTSDVQPWNEAGNEQKDENELQKLRPNITDAEDDEAKRMQK